MNLRKQSIWLFFVICVCFLCYLDNAEAEQATYAFTNKLNMRFISIPPGTFIMGSPLDEIGREHDEVQHSVTISKGFYISDTEVTQAQWNKLMGNNPSGFKHLGTDRPVEQVSWNDCMLFIEKLNSMERTDKYRLPTEAEWEYACRAGSKHAFAGGDITEASCNVIPALADMEIERQWAGLRPGTEQGIPYICPHPEIEGLYINAGHYRNGVVLGAASARLMAEIITGEHPSIDPAAYALDAAH